MMRRLALMMTMLSCAVFAQESTNKFTVVKSEKGPSRARMPHEVRRKGAIPGIVTYSFGKTASGERTHLYRIMGQGGVVADFLDYGARLYRLYVPDATGALTDLIADAKPSVVDYEKADDLGPVWSMRPIRQPRATGLVFESSNSNSHAKVTYWLDAQNRLSIESSISDTNAVSWCDTVRFVPITGGRSLAVTAVTNSITLAATTNVTALVTRPLTNAVQRTEIKLTK